MRQRVHETIRRLQLEQEGKRAGRRIEIRQQDFLLGVEPLDLESQVAGQGSGPAGAFSGHDAVYFTQLARLDVGIELDAFEPVEGGANLFEGEGLEQEFARALAQTAQNDVRIVTLVDRHDRHRRVDRIQVVN